MFFVIVGPSGAGKGAVAAGLVASVPDLWLSRSWTTRPRRASDTDDSYRFVDRATFEDHAAAGGFLEWAEVFGNLYGTPVPSAPNGEDVLLEIDVQGARQVKDRIDGVTVLAVMPPSRRVQAERLAARGDSEEVIRRRLAAADAEEEGARDVADYVILNDVLGRAVTEAAGIVEAHRLRRSRHQGREYSDG